MERAVITNEEARRDRRDRQGRLARQAIALAVATIDTDLAAEWIDEAMRLTCEEEQAVPKPVQITELEYKRGLLKLERSLAQCTRDHLLRSMHASAARRLRSEIEILEDVAWRRSAA